MKQRTVSAFVLVSLSAASALAPLSCDAPTTKTPSAGGDPGPGAGGSGGPGGQSGGSEFGGTAGVPIDPSGGGPAVLPFAGEPMPGYTLIASPENDAGADFNAFLIDLDGKRVHEWPITGFPPKMFPGGTLLGCSGGVPGNYDCAQIEQRQWDGTLDFSFNGFETVGSFTYARHHHDFNREGSPVGYFSPGQWPRVDGETLVLAMRERTVPELRAEPIREDVVYRLDSKGRFQGLVWESANHFLEFGFDEDALEDIRTRSVTGTLELLHGNTLNRVGPNQWYDSGRQEFHPDNLIYSSRQASFVVIISHETGEVVWRIGPDFARGPEAGIGQFAGQHFAHIIPLGLPGAGNMLVFDNGGASGYGGTPDHINGPRYGRTYSRVVEFNPTTFEVIWEYGGPKDPPFYSQLLGAAQRLPNGNTLITVGVPGQVLEVTPTHEVVWSYQYPFDGVNISHQWVYRAIRVPPEWLPNGENEALANYPSWGDAFGFGGAAQ